MTHISTREPLPPARGSWKGRLQHVRLQTKLVVPMVLLAVTPLTAIGGVAIYHMRASLRENALQRLQFDTSFKSRSIEEFLRGVQEDLLFLSQMRDLRGLASRKSRASVARANVEEQLLLFSQGRRAYYQIRLLDGTGREVVRLNAERGVATIVPLDQLQDKSNRYYVRGGLALRPGEIYASPMDLNIEDGKIEEPYRAVVRYATPVAVTNGAVQGLLVINVYADHLFSLLEPFPPETEGFLVDENGAYLGFAGASEEKRFRYHLALGRHLSEDFSEGEVQAILGTAHALETPTSFVSVAPVRYDNGTDFWTLVVSHPRTRILAPIRQLTTFLSIFLAGAVLLSALMGVLVAHYIARPIASLRRATRDIAEGNLKRTVEVTTGDEIESLGTDFNIMTAKLREAQERLAAWNEELESEVARQTDRLHRLQSGLARADTLASIGQMTASVMHEIGNPLAAIKTKIQVEEEEGDMPSHCQALLSEIVGEVDRLAAFLRSFSRLSNLGVPNIEEISLSEVVHGVETLVSPELRRRGVALQIEVAENLPEVEGDATQLRQLLINLVLNAAEATRGDDVVSVKACTAAGTPTIEVTDHGEGMTQETLQKIWDPFFTTKKEGTGLGLAICRQIVEDHGGTIDIRSERGRGTVVTVTFPPKSN